VRGGRAEDPPEPTDANGYARSLNSVASDGCASERFTCVFSGAAVLDHQTGLVWLRDFGGGWRNTWAEAFTACYGMDVNGVTGWRLPSASELMGLLGPNAGWNIYSLPPGYPFTPPDSFVATTFWSSTAYPGTTTDAFSVRFRSGYQLPLGIQVESKSALEYRTCVRGIGTP
jgi:hypothetical protein